MGIQKNTIHYITNYLPNSTTPTPPMSAEFANMKVADLKEELKSRNIPFRSKLTSKQVILDVLAAFDESPETIESYVKDVIASAESNKKEKVKKESPSKERCVFVIQCEDQMYVYSNQDKAVKALKAYIEVKESQKVKKEFKSLFEDIVEKGGVQLENMAIQVSRMPLNPMMEPVEPMDREYVPVVDVLQKIKKSLRKKPASDAPKKKVQKKKPAPKAQDEEEVQEQAKEEAQDEVHEAPQEHSDEEAQEAKPALEESTEDEAQNEEPLQPESEDEATEEEPEPEPAPKPSSAPKSKVATKVKQEPVSDDEEVVLAPVKKTLRKKN
jgi:hypothetical protein